MLATRGLSLNTAKLQVWNPHELAIPQAFRDAHPQAEITTTGFKVCGLPLDQADTTDPQDFTPLGAPEFTERFLAEAREATLRRLRVLTTFVHTLGPHTEALHVALRIARVNLQSRHVRLYRFCGRDTVHCWTAQLDMDIKEWLSTILDCPLDTPHAHIVHLLQAILPMVEELPMPDVEDNPTALLISETLEYLEHHAGAPLRQALLHLQPHRMGRRLRELFYEARGRQLRELCPWLQPPGLPSAPPGQPDISQSWQLQTHMAWYTASGPWLLQEGHLRFAIQKHVGLPVFLPGQRCGYTPLTTGRRCHHQLGLYSDHAFTCAQGPGLRRHNRLRDEQLVTVAPDEGKRADFVTLTPDGQRIACDIMVTASPTPWEAHGPHLDTSAAAKATRYRTVAGGLTHDRAQLVPLIHDAHNLWLSAGALRFLHRLVQAQARQTVSSSAPSWGHHHMTTALEAASSLLHAAVVAAWSMHAACGRLQ